MTDDYDDEYLKLDATNVEITDETGKGRHQEVQHPGQGRRRSHAYAKLVDTEIPATGETVRGDPQPEDLKATASPTSTTRSPSPPSTRTCWATRTP